MNSLVDLTKWNLSCFIVSALTNGSTSILCTTRSVSSFKFSSHSQTKSLSTNQNMKEMISSPLSTRRSRFWLKKTSSWTTQWNSRYISSIRLSIGPWNFPSLSSRIAMSSRSMANPSLRWREKMTKTLTPACQMKNDPRITVSKAMSTWTINSWSRIGFKSSAHQLSVKKPSLTSLIIQTSRKCGLQASGAPMSSSNNC